MAQIVWGTVGFAVLVLIAGAMTYRVARRALEGTDDGAADASAMVVRPTAEAPAHVGPRLRWEAGLPLRTVQCDHAARLAARKAEARELAIFRAVTGHTVVEMPRKR